MVSYLTAIAANWRIWGAMASVVMICLLSDGLSGEVLTIGIMAIVSHTMMTTKHDQLLVAIMTAANLYLIKSETVLSVYLGVEILSLAGYAILVQKNGQQRNLEGALRMAIPGTAGSLLMSTGLYLTYLSTGGFEIENVNLFFLMGILLKLATFPFFLYQIRVFEGAPLGVALVTTFGKIGLIYNLNQWIGLFGELGWWVGILT